MRKASVSELKSHLSAHLARVRRGEEVLVTDRGRPVARLIGVQGTQALGDALSALAADGLIRPPERGLPPALLRPSPARDPKGRVLAAVLEERRSGR